jgi:peroxiredoxin
MKKAILTLLIATMLALVSVGASCAGASTETVISNTVPPEIDKPAPDFSITNISGKTVALSDFKGKKVLLNFWAVLCTQCDMERSLLEAVHSKYPEIQIMMVDSKDDTGTIRKFVRNGNFTLPIYMDEQRIAAGVYDVHLIPKTFLIDSNGTVKYIQQGAFSNQAQLENALKSL